MVIPPDALKRGGARPGWDGGAYAFMRRVLETETGGALYRKRHRGVPANKPLLGLQSGGGGIRTLERAYAR